MNLPPLATTTVGSFPRPHWLSERERSEVTFRLEGELLREAQDDATIVILHEQQRAGLDLLTDGEQRRPHFINHVLGTLEGIDLVNRRGKAIRRRTDVERPVPRVVGPIRRRGVAVVGDLLFAKAHTSMPIKMAVPGPMTVVDSTYDEHYHDEERLALDVAAAINEELLALEAAGCEVAQIDEPAMTRYHEKVAAYGLKALDRCLEGVTMPTLVHLCYGYPGGGKRQHEYEYPELLELLMQSRIGGFSVEFARSGFDPALLAICRDRTVVFGCVDPGDTPPEPLETVVARVRKALAVVEPERLWLAPDCGLMTIERDLALAKARLLAAVARELRKEL
jgi:5-methyltetrahydropteroyltriglutamate--homocysteine methyltransferase